MIEGRHGVRHHPDCGGHGCWQALASAPVRAHVRRELAALSGRTRASTDGIAVRPWPRGRPRACLELSFEGLISDEAVRVADACWREQHDANTGYWWPTSWALRSGPTTRCDCCSEADAVVTRGADAMPAADELRKSVLVRVSHLLVPGQGGVPAACAGRSESTSGESTGGPRSAARLRRRPAGPLFVACSDKCSYRYCRPVRGPRRAAPCPHS